MKLRHFPFSRLFGLAMLLPFAAPTQGQDALAPRLTTTRVNLAHGREDSIREVGILSKDNKSGNAVEGASEVMDVIAALPNPRLITLDLNKDGNAPADMKKPSPILAADAASPLSSGMTLIVAEVPAGGTFDGWSSLATRFSDGNLYATVSIPAAKIVAGEELVTLQQLKDYKANSIFFEAPDFGTVVTKNDLTGGSTTVSAQINGKKFRRNFGFASPLQLTLSGRGTKGAKDKTAKVTFFAKLPTSFESPCLLRFAAKSDKETIIREVVLPAKPSDKKSSFRTARIVFEIQAELGSSVAISAVASPGPFLEPLPKAPQSVGMKTFQSRGSTLEDTLNIQIKEKKEIDFAASIEGTIKRHMSGQGKLVEKGAKLLDGGRSYFCRLDWLNKGAYKRPCGALHIVDFGANEDAAKKYYSETRAVAERIKAFKSVELPGADEAGEAVVPGIGYGLHARVAGVYITIGFSADVNPSNAELARRCIKTIIEQLSDEAP